MAEQAGVFTSGPQGQLQGLGIYPTYPVFWAFRNEVMNIQLSYFSQIAVLQKIRASALAVLAMGWLAGSASASLGPLVNQPPAGTTPEQIIQRFAAKEAEFKAAREHY